MSRPPADILARIVERRRERFADALRPPADNGQTVPIRQTNPLVAALSERRGRAVIAEVKLGSPSLGNLAGRIDPETLARSYRRNGAAAVSVVVEPDFFHGSYELLERVREASGLPAIAKDFVVSELQLRSAVAAGADAILLIASLYDREGLRRWAAAARGHGLVPLIETHDEADMELLGGGDWELVGINNRDLRTFTVDLERSIERLALLPAGALKVAESGIRGRREIDRLAAAGFDAFLVGEALVTAADPGAALAELAT